MINFIKKYRHWFILPCLVLCLVIVFGWIGVSSLREGGGRTEKIILQDESDALIPLETGTTVTQRLRLQQDCYGFLLAFDTGNVIVRGAVRAELCDADGTPLAAVELPMVELLNRTPATFLFPDGIPAGEQGREVLLRVSSAPDTPQDTVSVLATVRQAVSISPLLTVHSGAGEQQLTGGLYLHQLTAYSGAHGSLNLYFIIFALLCLLLLCAGYLLVFVWKVKLPVTVFILLLLGGMALSMAVPAPNGTDEERHLHTAYWCASTLLGQPTGSYGAMLARACDTVELDDGFRLSAFSYQDQVEKWEWRAADTALVETDWNTYDAVRPHYYLLYAPSVLGMTLGRTLGMGWLPVIALARFFQLAAFALLAALAVHIAPAGAKRLFFAVSLLPMTVQLFATVNDDAFLLAMALLLAAQVLAFLEHTGDITQSRWLLCIGTVLLIAGANPVYALLALYALLLPLAKFASLQVFLPAALNRPEKRRLRRNLLLCGGAVLGIGVLAVGAKLVSAKLLPMLAAPEIPLETQAAMAENIYVLPEYTLHYALTHVVDTVRLFGNTLQNNTGYYLKQMLGGFLGEPILVTLELSWLTMLAWVLLLGAALLQKEGGRMPSVWQRCVGAGVFLLLCAVTAVGCYTWTPFGHDTLWGLQGRYLLPALPVLAWALTPKQLVLKKDNTAAVSFGCCAVLVWSVLQVFVTVLGLSGLPAAA